MEVKTKFDIDDVVGLVSSLSGQFPERNLGTIRKIGINNGDVRYGIDWVGGANLDQMRGATGNLGDFLDWIPECNLVKYVLEGTPSDNYLHWRLQNHRFNCRIRDLEASAAKNVHIIDEQSSKIEVLQHLMKSMHEKAADAEDQCHKTCKDHCHPQQDEKIELLREQMKYTRADLNRTNEQLKWVVSARRKDKQSIVQQQKEICTLHGSLRSLTRMSDIFTLLRG